MTFRKVVLFALIHFLCTFTSLGAPMYSGFPESPPQIPPELTPFGLVPDHDLMKPAIPTHVFESQNAYDWNAFPLQESHVYQHDQYNHLPMPTWGQQDYSAGYHSLNTEDLPQQFYNTAQSGKPYTGDMHLGAQYPIDSYGNLQIMHDGQGSSTYPPVPTIPLHHQNSWIPFAARSELSSAELQARPDRLKAFSWQRKYTIDELLYLYSTIVHHWGSLPPCTLTVKLFPRLNVRLQEHPDEIDGIFAKNDDLISRTATNSGRRFERVDHPTSKSHRRMSPEKFIKWLTSLPKKGSKDVCSTSSSSIFAQENTLDPLSLLDQHTASIILDRLVRCWQSNRSEIEQHLRVLTQAEFATYVDLLKADDEEVAWKAAEYLRDYILTKGPQQ